MYCMEKRKRKQRKRKVPILKKKTLNIGRTENNPILTFSPCILTVAALSQRKAGRNKKGEKAKVKDKPQRKFRGLSAKYAVPKSKPNPKRLLQRRREGTCRGKGEYGFWRGWDAEDRNQAQTAKGAVGTNAMNFDI